MPEEILTLKDLEFKKFKKEGDGSFEGKIYFVNAEGELEIAAGRVTGKSSINKFGATPDFDSTDNWTTMWDGADDGGIDEMQYTYSASALIDSLSSDSASDTGDIEVQGLDTNWEMVTQTITLTGLIRVALTTDLRRVFRLKNVGSADFVGNIYCFEFTADVGVDGIPDDTSKIRAVVQIGNNQTLMAIYTVPANCTGFMKNWFASLSGIVPAGVNVRVKIFVRPFGQVFQLKHESALADDGTSATQHKFGTPEVLAEKSDIEIQVLSDSAVTSVAGGFDIILEED